MTSGNQGMVRNNGTPDTWIFSPDPTEYVRRDQAMRDVVGSKGVFHPCSNVFCFRSPGKPHTYQEEVLFGDPPTYAYIGDFVGYTPGMTAIDQLPADIYSRDGILPDDPQVGGFTRRAFNKVVDQMPETTSIINFILELEDLTDAIKAVKSALTNPAGLFLAWQFGVAPFIRDIIAILTTAARIRDQLDHLKKVNKRTVSIAYVENFNRTNDDPTPHQIVHQPGWGIYPADEAWRLTEARYRVQMNCQVHYDLDVDFENLLGYLKATLAALGIGNPLNVVWNAIPFSFVVDWFFNIGSFLDGFDIQPFKGTIVIEGCSFSVTSYVRVAHLNKTYKSMISPTLDRYEEFGSTQMFGYHRRHGTPEGDIDLTGLTPFQQLLAAALLAAQGKTWPTRRRR